MNAGDYVKVTTKKGTYEGIVMPRSELADEEHIVLKLKSGYNIGISKKDITKTEKLGQKKAKAAEPKLKFDKSKPSISMVSTGGTITSKVDYQTGGVSPLTKPEELLVNIPELNDFVNIKHMVQPFSMLSEYMTPNEWVEIAKTVHKELNSDIKGVIVTHGTDTLHYTAAALSFMLKNLSKPVALVGAQRSPDRGSSDDAMNLLCAAHYCLSDIAEASIVMHGTTEDEYSIASRGTTVRKMHSSRRDAFRPINEMPLAKIFPDGNLVVTNAEHQARTDNKVGLDAMFNDKVAMLQAYPGAKPSSLDHCVKSGLQGVIIAGTGFGHVNVNEKEKTLNWLSSIKNAVKSGVFVGITSQTLYGTTDPFVYSAGRLMHDAGATYLKSMLPETAYVKLGWSLGHTTDLKKVSEMMLTNYAGEITEKIDPESFLY